MTKIEEVTNSRFRAKLGLFDRFIHSCFDKLYALFNPTNLLNLFVFKNQFSKYPARMVKFRRFTCKYEDRTKCIFAVKKCDFSFSMFLKQKMSLNSRQPAESNEFKIFRNLKNLPKTGKLTKVFFLHLTFHLIRQSKLKV